MAEQNFCFTRTSYVDRNGDMELLLEEVASIEIEKTKILIKALFGEQKEVWANIKEIDFLDGEIILEENE